MPGEGTGSTGRSETRMAITPMKRAAIARARQRLSFENTVSTKLNKASDARGTKAAPRRNATAIAMVAASIMQPPYYDVPSADQGFDALSINADTLAINLARSSSRTYIMWPAS